MSEAKERWRIAPTSCGCGGRRTLGLAPTAAQRRMGDAGLRLPPRVHADDADRLVTTSRWNPMAQAFDPAPPSLASFLLERITEDEMTARALEPERERHPYGDRGLPPTPFAELDEELRGYLGGPLGEHAARWQPARVLAECEAKRQIVKLHRIETQTGSVWHDREDGLRELVKATEYACVICGWVMEDGPQPTGVPGCDTLRALAVPYAGHPDYRAEWRP